MNNIPPTIAHWQTMDSVEKDGTPVLVCCEGLNKPYVDVAQNSYIENGEDVWYARESRNRVGNPMFWAPLPEGHPSCKMSMEYYRRKRSLENGTLKSSV